MIQIKLYLAALAVAAAGWTGAVEISVPAAPGPVPGTEKYQISGSGLSGAVTLKTDLVDISGNDQEQYYDAFFYKRGSFVFGRRGDRLYFNFHDGKRWAAYIDSDAAFHLQSNRVYHLVFTATVHRQPSQGELWTDIVLYADGREVGRHRAFNLVPAATDAPVESCQAPSFGKGWGFHGEIRAGSVYDRALTPEDIEELVRRAPGVTPAFEILPELSAEAVNTLAAIRKSGEAAAEPARSRRLAAASALETLFKSGEAAAFAATAAELRKSGAAPETIGALQLIDRGDSILVLGTVPERNFCRILGWYDRRAGREVLAGASCDFFRAGELSMRTGAAALERAPYRDGEAVSFAVRCRNEEWSARLDFRFDGRRLEYTIDLAAAKPGVKLEEATFPSLRLTNFTTDAWLLSPEMSGVATPDATAARASYSAFYPTGRASMQLGAWYDGGGGVYFCTEDERARAKSISFRAEKNSLGVNYFWPVARPASGASPVFAPGSPAVLELFRGDWYDAGLIYRRFLRDRAVWCAAPRETPQWMRDNLMWIALYFYDHTPAQIEKLQGYLGLPFAMHYYTWMAKFDRDYPHFNANPESYNRFEWLKARGLAVVPYTNGRIWETLDRRDEDFEYTRYGVPNAVKGPDGSVAIESYNRVSFAVMCPGAPYWQKRVGRIIHDTLGLGVRGVYLDQIAAARPRLCFDPTHGHAPGDPDVWYMQGYRPALLAARKEMRRKHPDAVLTSEDNAEPYVGLMDGLLPWRWMYNHQVPLFVLCYSDRVELVGRAFGGDEPAAYTAKVANQLVHGEQLGWYGMGTITAPANAALRRLVKRGMHVRRSMLPYFQQGLLARPPELATPGYRPLRWGNFGTSFVDTPVIESASWRRGAFELFIFCNPTGEVRESAVSYSHLKRRMPDEKRALYEFSTHGAAGGPEAAGASFSRTLCLQPGEIRLWLVAAPGAPGLAEEAARLRSACGATHDFANDKDPFEGEKR